MFRERMEKDRIYVRDARREDARDIAGLIVHAWPVEEFLKVRPGMTVDRFSEFLQRFVEADDTLYSYTVTKVAVVAGQDGRERVAGMMNGYDGALYGELKRPVIEALVKEFGSCGDFDKTVETSAGEFYLDSASVSPEMRSMGIGSMLFSAMLERASSEGFKVVGLIVDEDKPKAEALYLRLGFEVVGYKDFLGHRMKHMQKSL